MLNEGDFEAYRKWWKKGKSSLKGFHKSYRAETPVGDVLQADFNYHERLVRLFIEVSKERGRAYTANVKQGSIIREKDITTGRTTSIKGRIHPFRHIFSCIPDDDLLESLGGAYEISRVSLGKPVYTSEPSEKFENFEFAKKESFFERLERKRLARIEKYGTLWQRFKKRFWGDLHDFVLGSSLGVAIYYHFFDFIILGATLAGFGFFFGGLDWIIRNRDPLMTKVFLFMGIGTYFFYTGYTKY